MTSRRTGTRGLSARPSLGVNKGVPELKVLNENGRNARPGKVGMQKRKAEDAALGDKTAKVSKKRSAFGDITNALEKFAEAKKGVQQKGKLHTSSTRSLVKAARPVKESVLPLSLRQTKEVAPKPKAPSAAKKEEQSQLKSVAEKPQSNKEASQTQALPPKKDEPPKTSDVRLKNVAPPAAPLADPECDLSYCDSLPNSQGLVVEPSKTDFDESAAYVTASEGSPLIGRKTVDRSLLPTVPEGVNDFDKEKEDDPFSVSIYANYIFNYYKTREDKFPVEKYMDRQTDISRSMRSILVDWMVEVQESFELNHETLYLGVKIVDFYLSKVLIKRDVLQLIGSTALFIACKFDERTPPYADDFLYICDDAYRRKELLAMEMKILKAIDFDLGIPLSYRFLRRYARCANTSMEDLTLTRYILEMSLMDYELIDSSDSALAASALLLSRIIKKEENIWTSTLEHYSGYKKEDLYHLTHLLHSMITQTPKDQLKTIRNKYSHSVFFKVAKIPIPEELDL